MLQCTQFNFGWLGLSPSQPSQKLLGISQRWILRGLFLGKDGRGKRERKGG